MSKRFLLPAILTGVFCAGFAVGIDYLTDMLARGQVVSLAFTSGFLGSIFSALVLGRRKWK